jgi:hypothetical protein
MVGLSLIVWFGIEDRDTDKTEEVELAALIAMFRALQVLTPPSPPPFIRLLKVSRPALFAFACALGLIGFLCFLIFGLTVSNYRSWMTFLGFRGRLPKNKYLDDSQKSQKSDFGEVSWKPSLLSTSKGTSRNLVPDAFDDDDCQRNTILTTTLL